VGYHTLANFHDVLFPVTISYGSAGGPGFLTTVLVLGSGHESRNINWAKSRAKYNATYGVRNNANLDAVLAFFYARQGQGYAFPYKDFRDYSVTGQILGTGNAGTKTFDLKKTYTSGAYTYDRLNILPIANTVKIYFDGTEQTSGWTVNREAATVTFTSAPGTGVIITADFEFHVPVRFATDDLSQGVEPLEHGTMTDIQLIEVRIK
jgi:uncharacterized protein (TIGR02217 family)